MPHLSAADLDAAANRAHCADVLEGLAERVKRGDTIGLKERWESATYFMGLVEPRTKPEPVEPTPSLIARQLSASCVALGIAELLNRADCELRNITPHALDAQELTFFREKAEVAIKLCDLDWWTRLQHEFALELGQRLDRLTLAERDDLFSDNEAQDRLLVQLGTRLFERLHQYLSTQRPVGWDPSAKILPFFKTQAPAIEAER